MDFDDDRNTPTIGASGYSYLNDAQLRSAIRFAEAHLRSIEENHDALRRAYRDELATMQSQLVDRLLARIIRHARPLSEQQRRELHRRFESHALRAAEVTALMRSVSRGRTGELDALTEIEAMAILVRLAPPI